MSDKAYQDKLYHLLEWSVPCIKGKSSNCY